MMELLFAHYLYSPVLSDFRLFIACVKMLSWKRKRRTNRPLKTITTKFKVRRLERKIRHSWLQRTRRRNFHVVMCHDSYIHVLLNILKSIEVTGSIIIQYSLNFQGTIREYRCLCISPRPTFRLLCSFLSLEKVVYEMWIETS